MFWFNLIFYILTLVFRIELEGRVYSHARQIHVDHLGVVIQLEVLSQKVASNYDIMNDVMSCGFHKVVERKVKGLSYFYIPLVVRLVENYLSR